MLELERIHSHILWTGIAGHILGFDTVLMQTWRIREPVMWLCELITGNRKQYGMNLIGGVRRDIPREIHPKIHEVLDGIEREWKALISAIGGDTPLMMRLKDVGTLPYDKARLTCVVGPTARGSGVGIDARLDHPYAAFAEVPPELKVQESGDVLGRTMVRLEETLASIDVVRRALQAMPEGPIMAEIDSEIPPGREGICSVEAPRGEVFHYVLTGENNRPYRWKVRAPTYVNLQSVPLLIKEGTVADVTISLGSIDPCFSCTERLEVVDVRSGEVKVYRKDELLKLTRGKK
jgi:Ni,Fe-hydrogenase III large subunit